MPGDLYREAGDAAGATLYQDRLARPDLQGVFHGAQSRQPDQCHRGGFDMGQAGRLAREERRPDRHLLCIGSLDAHVADSEHLVADLEIRHAVAKRADHPGEIPARGVWKKGDRPVGTGDHPPVGAVHARGVHVDQDLAWLHDRIGIITEFEDFRPAVLAEERCFHGTPRSAGGRI